MKLTIHKIILLSTIILALVLLCTAVETKKEQTMMDYLNTLFSHGDNKENIMTDSTNNNLINSHLKYKKKHNKKNSSYRFSNVKDDKLKTENKEEKKNKKEEISKKDKEEKKCNDDKEIYKQVIRYSKTEKELIKDDKTKNKNDKKDNKKDKKDDKKDKNKITKTAEGIDDNIKEDDLPASNGLAIEGELFIASSAFKNKLRFPPIIHHNGVIEEIEVDPEMFRVNNQLCKDNENNCKLNFWFRLAPNIHLYYASTEQDLNILGSISIKSIVTIGSPSSPIITQCGEAYCFEIEDTVDSNWKLCAKTRERAIRWICALKKALEIEDKECSLENLNVKIIEKHIKEPIIIIPLPSRHCNEGWNYQKYGDDWECDCKTGIEQSPIDLPLKENAIDSPIKALFSFNEIPVRNRHSTIDNTLIEDQSLTIRLFDNSIRVFHHNFGKVTTMDGAIYHAEEIVFHTPSEHTINGNKFDMEVQVVHYGQSKGDINKQLILSFLVKKSPGVYNKFFDDLDVFNLPDAINQLKELNNNLYIPKLFYNSSENDLPIMKPFSFYTYQGSLTSPPCTERTIMYVASKPIELSSTTIQLFQEALRVPDLMDKAGNIISNDLLPFSSRRTQERNGRPVFFYDHVKYNGPDPVHKHPKPLGHYEKVEQKHTNYFYVGGEKPSGLPGAFIVSDKEAKGERHDYEISAGEDE